MGTYDVNLKKTRIGYQFDHNVYIGFQVNDNRVVTFKDLKGYAAGGGGGGGSVSDVTLEFLGQHYSLKVNNVEKSSGDVQVSTLTFAAGATIPDTAVICLVDTDGRVYKTGTQWNTIADQLAQLANLSITTAGGVTTIAPQSGGTLVLNGTASKVAHPLQLSIGGTNYSYDGSANVNISLSTIGTVAAGTMSIALPNAASASDNDIPTVGYIKNSGLGGIVYSTAQTPWGPTTVDEDTRFIFVEE